MYESTTCVLHICVSADTPWYVGHWIHSLLRPYGSPRCPGLYVSCRVSTCIIDPLFSDIYFTRFTDDQRAIKILGVYCGCSPWSCNWFPPVTIILLLEILIIASTFSGFWVSTTQGSQGIDSYGLLTSGTDDILLIGPSTRVSSFPILAPTVGLGE